MKNGFDLSSSFSSKSSSSSTSSNPVDTVIANMQGQTITNGWDAVCAININKANELFALRFADILGQGLDNNDLILSGTSPDGTVMLNNITLSQPLIQIKDDFTGSNVSLSFLLLAGTITTTSSINKGSIGSVVNITPSLDLQISTVVPIVSTSATVSSNGVIYFNVKDKYFNINNDIIWDPTTKNILLNYMSDLIGGSGLNLKFPIATIPTGTSGDLMPGNNIAFATQQNNNNPDDAGRLLIFMSTTFNPDGGSQNSLNVSNVVPDNYDNALILSSNAFLQVFTQSFTANDAARVEKDKQSNPNMYANEVGISFAVTNNTDQLSSAKSNSGNFVTVTPPYCWFVTFEAAVVDQIGWVDVSLPWSNIINISFNSSCGNYNISFNGNWSQDILAGPNLSEGATCAYSDMDGSTSNNGTMSINGSGSLIPTIDNTNSNISFSISGLPTISTSGYSDNIEGFLNNLSALAESAQIPCQRALQNVITPNLPSINTFVLENFLFSSDSKIQMQKAYTPGDLIVFGTTQMPSWYLTASDTSKQLPIAVVPAGSSITMSSNGSQIPQQINWTNSSSIGTITPESNGVATYTAPTTVTNAQVVTVKASDASNPDSETVLPLIVVPNSLIINPSFAVLTAGSGGMALTASANSSDTVTWTSSNPSAGITFIPTSSPTPRITSSNSDTTELTRLTAIDSTNNIAGSAFVLTVPLMQAAVVGVQKIIQEGSPGDTIDITAVNLDELHTVTSIVSWQQFDENNMSGVTLPGNGMTQSVTIAPNATPGSTIFIVINAKNAEIPSAVAAIVVTSTNSSL